MLKKFLFLFSIFFFSWSQAKEIHPYHVGSVELNYNSKTNTYEISAKFFLDDLENGLKEKYGIAVHFNDEKYKKQINELLSKYCSEYLKLKSDNNALKINYIGFEEDNESVNLFLESEVTTQPKKVEVAVSFLYNLYDDQMNIIHIIVNGKRQSERLNYPNRYIYKNF